MALCQWQTWENDDQPLLDFAELTVLLSSVTAAFVCESQRNTFSLLPRKNLPVVVVVVVVVVDFAVGVGVDDLCLPLS